MYLSSLPGTNTALGAVSMKRENNKIIFIALKECSLHKEENTHVQNNNSKHPVANAVDYPETISAPPSTLHSTLPSWDAD